MQAHRTAILSLLALLVLGGFAAAFTLPVALFPHADFPRIVINIDAGDRPAERMVIDVTVPVEEAIRSVPGLRSIRSKTSRGSRPQIPTSRPRLGTSHEIRHLLGRRRGGGMLGPTESRSSAGT